MSKTLQCPECGYTRPKLMDPDGKWLNEPVPCLHCPGVFLVDRETFRDAAGDLTPDVMEVDSQAEAETFEQEAITFDPDAAKAYINVSALLDLTETPDTPENRHVITLPVAAMVRQWGFEPVLVGLSD